MNPYVGNVYHENLARYALTLLVPINYIQDRQRRCLQIRLRRQRQHNLDHPGDDLRHLPAQRLQRTAPGEQQVHPTT